MDSNFESNKENIIAELNKRIPALKCPMCNHGSLELCGGYFAHDLQEDLANRRIGGVNIPTVPVICKKCGYVMEFAVGALGLLPKADNDGK